VIRPQIVVSVGPNQVRLDDQRQAALLQAYLAVADKLRRYWNARVIPPQMSEAADYRRYPGGTDCPGDAATLDAVWTVSRAKDGKSQTGRTAVREPASQGGFDGLAAAHSRALARLSRDIADALQALTRSGQ
jgi:hypothetical protein